MANDEVTDMDFQELNYLLTIAQEGSISKAAERLFMAQASLSQFLRQYEASLGAPIFERTNRGVRLTPAGEAFLARSRQILSLYHQARSEFKDIEGAVSGVVKFGTASFRGRYLVPAVLKRFYREHPGAQVEITEENSVGLEQLIRDGALDVALAAVPVAPSGSIEVGERYHDEILIVAADDHPVMRFAHEDAGRRWVELSDAAAFEFILSDQSTRLGHAAFTAFERLNIAPICRNHHMTAAFAAAMAREGLGLALTYRSCMVPQEHVVYLSCGKEGLTLELALLYPRGNYRSRATEVFSRMLHENLLRVLTTSP